MDRRADTYVAQYARKVRHHRKYWHDLNKPMLPETHTVKWDRLVTAPYRPTRAGWPEIALREFIVETQDNTFQAPYIGYVPYPVGERKFWSYS